MRPGYYAWWPKPKGGAVEFIQIRQDGSGYKVVEDLVIPPEEILKGRLGIRLTHAFNGIPLDEYGNVMLDQPREMGW